MRDPTYLNDKPRTPLFIPTPEKEGEKDNDINQQIHPAGSNEPVKPSVKPVSQNIDRLTGFTDHPLDDGAEEENNTARATLGDPNNRDTTSQQEYDADESRFEPIDKNAKLNTPNNRNTRANVNTSGVLRQRIEENENPLLQDHGEVVNIDKQLNNSFTSSNGETKPMTETKPISDTISEPTRIKGTWGSAPDADDSGVLPGLQGLKQHPDIFQTQTPETFKDRSDVLQRSNFVPDLTQSSEDFDEHIGQDPVSIQPLDIRSNTIQGTYNSMPMSSLSNSQNSSFIITPDFVAKDFEQTNNNNPVDVSAVDTGDVKRQPAFDHPLKPAFDHPLQHSSIQNNGKQPINNPQNSYLDKRETQDQDTSEPTNEQMFNNDNHPKNNEMTQMPRDNANSSRNARLVNTSTPMSIPLTQGLGEVDAVQIHRNTVQTSRATDVQTSRNTVQASRDTAQASRNTVQPSRDTFEIPRAAAQTSRNTVQPSRDTFEIPRAAAQTSRDTVQIPRDTFEIPRATAQTSRATAAQTSRNTAAGPMIAALQQSRKDIRSQSPDRRVQDKLSKIANIYHVSSYKFSENDSYKRNSNETNSVYNLPENGNEIGEVSNSVQTIQITNIQKMGDNIWGQLDPGYPQIVSLNTGQTIESAWILLQKPGTTYFIPNHPLSKPKTLYTTYSPTNAILPKGQPIYQEPNISSKPRWKNSGNTTDIQIGEERQIKSYNGEVIGVWGKLKPGIFRKIITDSWILISANYYTKTPETKNLYAKTSLVTERGTIVYAEPDLNSKKYKKISNSVKDITITAINTNNPNITWGQIEDTYYDLIGKKNLIQTTEQKDKITGWIILSAVYYIEKEVPDLTQLPNTAIRPTIVSEQSQIVRPTIVSEQSQIVRPTIVSEQSQIDRPTVPDRATNVVIPISAQGSNTSRLTVGETSRPTPRLTSRVTSRVTVPDRATNVDIPVDMDTRHTIATLKPTARLTSRFTPLDNNGNGDDSPINRHTSIDVNLDDNEHRTDVAAGITSSPPNNSNLTEETAQPNQCDMSASLNTLFDKGTGIYLNILNKMAEDEPNTEKKQKINELIENLKSGSSEMNETLKSFIEKLKTIYPECDNSRPSNQKIENILKLDAGTAIGSALMAIMLLGGKKKKTRGKKHRVSKKKSRRLTKK